MKIYYSVCIIILLATASIACNKDSDDNSFFIEATINGEKWRGESSGYYLASRSDNSKMKIFIGLTDPPTTSFNFFSNSSLRSTTENNPDFVMPYFVIGAFGSKAQLNWQTTMESNIDRFEIERSTNPSTFQTIGSIPGSGTSSTLKTYSFTDDDLNLDHLTTTVRYRIRAVTTVGTIRFTEVKTFNVVADKAQIAYQNNNGNLYFALDNNQNQMSVTSYDPNTSERRGTFSFNYKDPAGNIVQVRNGRFHLKL